MYKPRMPTVYKPRPVTVIGKANKGTLAMRQADPRQSARASKTKRPSGAGVK